MRGGPIATPNFETRMSLTWGIFINCIFSRKTTVIENYFEENCCFEFVFRKNCRFVILDFVLKHHILRKFRFRYCLFGNLRFCLETCVFEKLSFYLFTIKRLPYRETAVLVNCPFEHCRFYTLPYLRKMHPF